MISYLGMKRRTKLNGITNDKTIRLQKNEKHSNVNKHQNAYGKVDAFIFSSLEMRVFGQWYTIPWMCTFPQHLLIFQDDLLHFIYFIWMYSSKET